MKRIKHLFSLPESADEGPWQRSRIFFLTWIVAASVLALFIGYYIVFNRSYNLVPMVALELATIVSFVLYKRGHSDPAANLLVWSFMAGLFGLGILNSGLRDTAFQAFPAILIAAALLLEHRQLVGLSICSFLTFALLGFLQLNTAPEYQTSAPFALTDLFDLLTIHGATIILVVFVFSFLKSSQTKAERGEAQLSETQVRYRELFNNVDLALFQTSREGAIFAVNPALSYMFGFNSPEELIASVGNVASLWADPNQREKLFRVLDEHPTLKEFEILYRRRDGSTFLGRMQVHLVIRLDGQLDFYQGFIEDITERRKAENALRESQALTNAIVNSTSDMIWSVDAERFGLLTFNEGLRRYFLEKRAISIALGNRPDDLFPTVTFVQCWHDFYRHALAEGSYSTEYSVFAGSNVLQLTFNLLKRDGTVYGISVFGRDITEQKKAEEKIRQSLAEKEILLRELYHRTQNNMAVIIALLDMQALMAENPALTGAISEAQHRIRSMALVHQKLYAAKDLSRIDLKEYITELVAILSESFAVSSRVAVQLELEPVTILIDSAIPCGLVLNELITNAFRHAFLDGREGKVSITLRRASDGQIQLEIADNGAGLPPGFDLRRDGRLGLRNVFSLVEDQLHGRTEIDTSAGVAWLIEFRDDLYRPRV